MDSLNVNITSGPICLEPVNICEKMFNVPVAHKKMYSRKHFCVIVIKRKLVPVFIKSKKKEVIVDMIIQLRMSIFGAASIFRMDKGGEFANDEMRELGNQLGINIKDTAAYAPWANEIN